MTEPDNATQTLHHHLQIPLDAIGQRLDSVVAKLLPDYSRAQWQSWIKQGALSLDGKTQTKPKTKLLGGEQLEVCATLVERTRAAPQAMDLEIVFEDDALMVLNKPPGLVVHPGAGNPDGTLLNGLLHYHPPLEQVPRGGIVHRLDKDTSGLMVVAKTLKAQAHLVAQLQAHTVARVYDAVVVGKMISGGTVDRPIGRDPRQRQRMAVLSAGGKQAVSHYRVKEKFRGHTHVRVALETGRTHQIRVHMAHLGFPLVGDPVYGGRLKLPPQMLQAFADFLRQFPRQALHAGQLTFTHPTTGQSKRFKAPLPDDFLSLLDILRDDIEDHLAQKSPEAFEEDDLDHGVEVHWVTDEDSL